MPCRSGGSAEEVWKTRYRKPIEEMCPGYTLKRITTNTTAKTVNVDGYTLLLIVVVVVVALQEAASGLAGVKDLLTSALEYHI